MKTVRNWHGSSTYKGYPVGVWASNIRSYKNISERYSLSTIDDLHNPENADIIQTLSASDLSKIKSYLSLTPEELLKLDNANILKTRSNSTAISLHKKVQMILDFCKTGQELTRSFCLSRISSRSMGYSSKIF